MTDSIQTTSRETLDTIIARTITIYRWAVYISFAFIGAGFLIAALANQSVDAEMESPLRLTRQMLELKASGYFGTGIGVMILTPIVMITAGAAAFFKAGDRRYGFITIAVATILSLSIIISFVIG